MTVQPPTVIKEVAPAAEAVEGAVEGAEAAEPEVITEKKKEEEEPEKEKGKEKKK